MKILTGRLKGRVIQLKPNENLRPTTDLVRKAVFDTLRGAIEGRRVLDLFSGTGAMGFEALSSGAAEVVWVDSDREQARSIEKTILQLKLEDSGGVMRSDALVALESLAADAQTFGLFFLDPPYKTALGVRALERIAALGLAEPGAILVLETHKTVDPPETAGSFRVIKTKKHGDTKLTFYLAG